MASSLRNQGFLGREAAVFGQAEKIPFQHSILAVHGPDPGHDDNIVTRQQLVLLEAVNLPQTAADPVADHRVAQLGPGGQAQAALLRPFFRQ